jgi:nitrogen fixation/metabolism regulation signal transduction histidine kinase
MRDLVNLFKIILIAIGIFLALIIGLIIFVTMHGTDVSNVTSSISVNKTIIQNSASEVQESSDYAYENDLELT